VRPKKEKQKEPKMTSNFPPGTIKKTYNKEVWKFLPGLMGVDAFRKFYPDSFKYQFTANNMEKAFQIAEKASFVFSA
jgi:hypothetical protein